MPFKKRDGDNVKTPKLSLIQKLRHRSNPNERTDTQVPGKLLTPSQPAAFQEKYVVRSETTAVQAPPAANLPVRSKNPFRKGLLGRTPKRPCYCSRNATPLHSIADTGQGPRCTGCGHCQVCSPEVSNEAYSRCITCQRKSPFIILPSRVHAAIRSRLDISTQWLLAITCRKLYVHKPAGDPTQLDPTFYILLRTSVPSHIPFCEQCSRYHPLDTYTWQGSEDESPQHYCLRHLDRTGQHPANSEFSLGTTHYVCRHCRSVQADRQCETCAKCEVCAGIKYGGYATECIECDAGKARCTRCRRIRLPRGACEKCGRCETCAGCLFQFGDTLCVPCGGKPKSDRRTTRRALVESGPGYDFYYYNPSAPLEQKDKKIGIR